MTIMTMRSFKSPFSKERGLLLVVLKRIINETMYVRPKKLLHLLCLTTEALLECRHLTTLVTFLNEST